MKKLKVYEYAKCDTCRKALKFLDAKQISYERVDVTTSPPSRRELAEMVNHVGDVKRLFNTSGVAYKEMKLSAKLPGLSRDEAIDLLAGNGRLVKRPFVLGADWGLVGFREEEWKQRF